MHNCFVCNEKIKENACVQVYNTRNKMLISHAFCEPEPKRYFQIRPVGQGSSVTVESKELEGFILDCHPVEVKVIEMTEPEFNNLPEFQGF